MPLRASARAISMPIPAYSELEVTLHSSSQERSSTPFPVNITTERFEYPFPTPEQHQRYKRRLSLRLAPLASSPWPSPSSSPSSSSLPHGPPPRAYAAVHGHGFWPHSRPNTPPVNATTHAHAYRLGHAHINPVQLCALACAHSPVPPSLAHKRGMLELRISSSDSRGMETTSTSRNRA
ncbi:hypothetical protein BJ912DRAFT_1008288 [Pholiota molesta]|nr:hypothetical protein BJ912DRAFT_1008288 [Pholiota molesta]